MMLISGYVDVPKDDLANFVRALPEHSCLTNAEPGCQYFRVTSDDKIAGRFHVEETFDDETAYQVHMTRTAQTEWAVITRNIVRNYTTSLEN